MVRAKRHLDTSGSRAARFAWNRDFQAPFVFFLRSAHHFRFASLMRRRAAALICRRRGFSVFRAFLRPRPAAVAPSRAAMAWLSRSRSAFSSVRIVSSVKGGSSSWRRRAHVHNIQPAPASDAVCPTADEYTLTRPQSHHVFFFSKSADRQAWPSVIDRKRERGLNSCCTVAHFHSYKLTCGLLSLLHDPYC